jgi:hypothetical protein
MKRNSTLTRKAFTVITVLISFIFISSTVKSQVTCGETFVFGWKNAANNGFVWPITNGEASITKTYTKVGVSGVAVVKVTLDNPDGKNIDFSNCGTNGNHFYTSTHSDPNASYNCGPGPDGQYSFGPDYLTLGMTSATSNDKVSITFVFETPCRITDFDIWDIDYQGGGNAGSWEDEMDIKASFAGTPVIVKSTAAGSAVIVSGNNTTAMNIRSLYGNGNGNLSPTDPAGSIHISTDDLVTSFTLTYSNGPHDDGISDDHAIKLGSFKFCPSFPVILPVKQHSFEAITIQSNINLQWVTSAEQDIKEYQVEYAENGGTFATIATFPSKGSTADKSHYNYQHRDILLKTVKGVYYRIKMIDNAGNITYSKIIHVKNITPSGELKIYPNPLFNGDDMVIQKTDIRQVTLYNAAGAIIFNKQYNGINTVIIPGSTFVAKGLLLVNINSKIASKIIVN